jgi:hypothetical protein
MYTRTHVTRSLLNQRLSAVTNCAVAHLVTAGYKQGLVVGSIPGPPTTQVWFHPPIKGNSLCIINDSAGKPHERASSPRNRLRKEGLDGGNSGGSNYWESPKRVVKRERIFVDPVSRRSKKKDNG